MVGGVLNLVLVPDIEEDGRIDVHDVVDNAQERLAWVGLTQVKPETAVLHSCPPDIRNILAS